MKRRLFPSEVYAHCLKSKEVIVFDLDEKYEVDLTSTLEYFGGVIDYLRAEMRKLQSENHKLKRKIEFDRLSRGGIDASKKETNDEAQGRIEVTKGSLGQHQGKEKSREENEKERGQGSTNG